MDSLFTLFMQSYTTLLCIYNEILNLLIRLLILSACQKAKRGVSTCTPSSLILNSAQPPGFRSQKIISASCGHFRRHRSIIVLFKRWLEQGIKTTISHITQSSLGELIYFDSLHIALFIPCFEWLQLPVLSSQASGVGVGVGVAVVVVVVVNVFTKPLDATHMLQLVRLSLGACDWVSQWESACQRLSLCKSECV